MVTQRGDELIDLLCAGGPFSLANELLTEVQRGFPATHLRRLLSCEPVDAVRSGAWILSELGEAADELADVVPSLLRNPHKYVRFFALDVALVATADPEAMMRAIALVHDKESSVRWKAMRFLSRASSVQLCAGTKRMAEGSPLKDLTAALIELEAGAHAWQLLMSGTDSADRTTALFAAAAASRLARQYGSRSALELAAASNDNEIGEFAREELAELG